MSDTSDSTEKGQGTAEPAPLSRISTGVPGLDVLLRGGWLHGGLYIVSGPPGSGKTVLGNQLVHHVAREGGQAVYVTLLAESHGRMVQHLSNMRFFAPDAVGASIQYLSGYPTLKSEGQEGLLKLLFRQMREHRARALVVDGLMVVEERAGSRLAYREWLHALGVQSGLAGCTTVLLTTQASRGSEAEHAMADGIVELSSELLGLKSFRGLEVTKLRGAAQLTGKHTFHVSEEGLAVYPRTEALYAGLPRVPPEPGAREATGVRSLDAMMAGGLVRNSSTLLLGSPGAGKTLLGLSFLTEGARQGQQGLYYGFAEAPDRLLANADAVGIPLRREVEAGRVRLEARVPTETLPDALVQELLGLVEAGGVRRLMLDGLEPFAKEAIDPERTSRFVTALLNALRERRVTVVTSQQTNALFGPELYAPLRGAEAIVDNILFLRFVELRSRLHRLVSVLKMRESEHDLSLRTFTITDRGMEVAGRFEDAESLLTGQAQPSRPARPTRPGKAAPRKRPRTPGRRR